MALYATNRFAGDGTTTTYEFNFVGKYISRGHVKAYQEDDATKVRTPVVITDAQFLNDTTLHGLPVTPVGSTLVIYRETPRTALVDFVSGARFTEYNMDLVARQGLFVATEAMDAGDVDAREQLLTAISVVMGLVNDATAAVSDSTQAALEAAQSAAAALADAASASASAGTATAAATAAEAARVAAVSAASSATTSADTATTKAGEALASATAASGSATTASTAATTATGAASAASASATTAAQSAASLGVVSVKTYGAVGDGVADDTSAIQAAINFAKTKASEVFFPPGDYNITGLLVDGVVKLRGIDSSTSGSRLFITANAPAITVTSACTIDSLAIYGQGDGAKSNQHGIKITASDVYVRDVFIDNCYDGVHIFGEVFYAYLDACRWYRSVRTMLYAEGNTAPGFAIQILNCQATPPSGSRGFWFKNFGSVLIDSLMMSPNNLTNEGIVFDTPAAAAGISQISNTVIEGSDGNPLKVIGASGASQAKFLFCANSYFGSGSTAPAVHLVNTRGVYFSNCYFTGSGDGLLLVGTVASLHVADSDFQVLGTPVIADTASVLSGLYFTSPDYQGASVFMNLNAATTKQNVSVVGGIIGSNSNPIQPNTLAGLYVRLPGVTKYNNGGIASFNGGTSLFVISHGLVKTPTKFSVVPNSLDAGVAEIREVTVNASSINVQCKAAATGGTNNVRWAWSAET